MHKCEMTNKSIFVCMKYIRIEYIKTHGEMRSIEALLKVWVEGLEVRLKDIRWRCQQDLEFPMHSNH